MASILSPEPSIKLCSNSHTNGIQFSFSSISYPDNIKLNVHLRHHIRTKLGAKMIISTRKLHLKYSQAELNVGFTRHLTLALSLMLAHLFEIVLHSSGNSPDGKAYFEIKRNLGKILWTWNMSRDQIKLTKTVMSPRGIELNSTSIPWWRAFGIGGKWFIRSRTHQKPQTLTLTN